MSDLILSRRRLLGTGLLGAGMLGTMPAWARGASIHHGGAIRSGFDEVEIDDTLAARQPEDQWLARAKWEQGDYQARLRG